MNNIRGSLGKLTLAVVVAPALPWVFAGSGPWNSDAAVPKVSDGGCLGQSNGHGQGHRAMKNRDSDEHEDEVGDRDGEERRGRGGRPMSPIFGTRDRETIVGFYRDRYAALPPGLAKRGGNLPPGLEKHLERNGTLPPGLQKRLEPFPVELERRLPPLPAIYQRGVIGSDVVVVNRRTGAILDIIRGVISLSRP
jgi:hypothetical protein